MNPAFQLHLTDQIDKGKVTVARYDGKNPSLTCATAGSKVFVHNPHSVGEDREQLFYLSINREVTALSSGRLNQALGRDVLLVGTPSNLQAYDVDQNRDLFFTEVSEGVSSLAVGRLGGVRAPVALVGGNCSVQGFDAEGNEQYWTVAGDVVTALALADINGDGANELLVGGQDFEIMHFKHEDCVGQCTEAEVVTGLTAITGPKFGYALQNGTVGVYDRRHRAWRVKSKHAPHSICSFDMDGDGVPELVSGWSNGKVEVRNSSNGTVVSRDSLASSVSAVLAADFRNDGSDCLMVCSESGEVRGYFPLDPDDGRQAAMDPSSAQNAIAELNNEKNAIKAELDRLSERNRKSSAMLKSSSEIDFGEVILPQDTEVRCKIASNSSNSCVDINLSTTNGTIIRGAVVFGEQLFEGESLYVSPKHPSSTMAIPVRPTKDVPVEVMIKAFVSSSPSNPAYHVFDLEARLSKFCMFEPVPEGAAEWPASYVQLALKERPQRLGSWLMDKFGAKIDLDQCLQLDESFMHMRTQTPLHVKMSADSVGPNFWIYTEDMEVAAELVQDLAGFLGLQELESVAGARPPSRSRTEHSLLDTRARFLSPAPDGRCMTAPWPSP